jgi:hypothetical protein
MRTLVRIKAPVLRACISSICRPFGGKIDGLTTGHSRRAAARAKQIHEL